MTKRDERRGRNELVRQVCLAGWPAALRLAFLEGTRVVLRLVLLAATLWLTRRPW
jgi:hypothetical protein